MRKNQLQQNSKMGIKKYSTHQYRTEVPAYLYLQSMSSFLLPLACKRANSWKTRSRQTSLENNTYNVLHSPQLYLWSSRPDIINSKNCYILAISRGSEKGKINLYLCLLFFLHFHFNRSKVEKSVLENVAIWQTIHLPPTYTIELYKTVH